MDEVLRTLQLTELEILSYVDTFCRKHGIRYSLSGGTLLGAIRHHGFIPWDDDVDIMMMREDYDRFLALWNQFADKKYILQTKDLYPDYYQSFAKVRKDNTTFLQQGEASGKYHTGIFIDIMPADRFPEGKLPQKLYYKNVMMYQLFTREFAPQNNGKLKRTVARMILRLTPKTQYPAKRQKYYKKLVKYNDQHSLKIISTETVKSMKRHYSSDLMDEFIDVEFEGKQFMCSSKWKEILVTGYGDYMKLPPEEERAWRHKPVAISFTENLEDR